MGEVRVPPPVQFFASIIFSDSAILSEVEAALTDFLGLIKERTPVMSFSQSDYYCREMGSDLKRYFILFRPFDGRERLAELKLATNGVEVNHAHEGRRRVNIDPGYIALEQMVLATTKGFAHRVYLGNGIFGDLTLTFDNGTYHRLPWTYPDYGSEELIALLNSWRERYKGLLKCQKV
jgi:hypothetical protein